MRVCLHTSPRMYKEMAELDPAGIYFFASFARLTLFVSDSG